MIKKELLLPVGSMEAFKAALSVKADAIYFGYTRFSARKRATNFTLSKVIDLINTAHKHNIKVYLTLNTIIFDSEIPKLISFLYFLNKLRPDAVILQDIGLYNILKNYFPNLILHASTQMNNTSIESFRFLEELGFKRGIAARECTKSELEKIKKDSSIEVEGFIHGAHCIGYSGICSFSFNRDRRSGNRGDCAQPCRLIYKEESMGKDKWLSPKDLCLIEDIKDHPLDYLKVEGRLKTADYIITIGENYLNALKGEKILKDELKTVFNRGYTSGNYSFRNPSDLLIKKSNEIPGRIIGRFNKIGKNHIVASLEIEVNSGDGIIFSNRGGIVTKVIRVNKKYSKLFGDFVFTEFNVGKKVILTSRNISLKNDIKVYEYFEKVPIELIIEFDKNIEIKIFDSCFKSSQIAERAKKTDSKQILLKKLRVLKNKKVVLDIKISGDEGFFISFSAINILKREISELLMKKIKNDIKNLKNRILLKKNRAKRDIIKNTAKIFSKKDLYLFKKSNLVFENLYFHHNLFDNIENDDNNIPYFLPVEYIDTEKILIKLKSKGYKRILCSDSKTIYLAKKHGFKIYLDYFFPIVNSFSIKWAKEYGIKRVCISPELPESLYESLIDNGIEIEKISSHRPILFFSACCFFNQYDKKKLEFKDQRENQIIMKKYGCLNIALDGKIKKYPENPYVDFHRIDFSFLDI